MKKVRNTIKSVQTIIVKLKQKFANLIIPPIKITNIYFRYLSGEIPGIIQILSIIPVFTFLAKYLYHINFLTGIFFVSVVSLGVNFLMNSYLSSRFFLFIKEQIVDQYSELNRLKFDYEIFRKDMYFLARTTGITLSIVAGALSALLLEWNP